MSPDQRIYWFGPSDDCAGLFAVDFPWGSWRVTVHLGVRKGHRFWGRRDWWWDGPMPAFGAGPVAMLCACEGP